MSNDRHCQTLDSMHPRFAGSFNNLAAAWLIDLTANGRRRGGQLIVLLPGGATETRPRRRLTSKQTRPRKRFKPI